MVGPNRSPLMTPFHALHHEGLLILPNAWDGGSAALTEAFLADGRSEPLGEGAMAWAEVNALMPG